MTIISQSYNTLQTMFDELYVINSMSSILHWDAEVMLPKDAVNMRGEQLSFLTKLYSSKMRTPNLSHLINTITDEGLNEWEARNLERMRHIHTHNTVVPIELLATFSELSNKCTAVWRDAYKTNDWNLLLPHLTELVETVRQIAQIKSQAFGVSPYDALLDEYDPGSKSASLDVYFEPILKELPGMIATKLSKQNSKPKCPKVSIKAQKECCLKLMKTMGFNFATGRLDTSTHPFCGGGYPDIRITTRYDENEFSSSIYGVIHETGHALYEAGLPQKWRRQPIGGHAGMSVHESQSLFAEKQIGLESGFINLICSYLGLVDEIEAIESHLLFVERSLIRVNADEMTYPLHIILRYNIEKDLISQDIEVKDIPSIWNEQMLAMLGIEPKTDSEGCMQDIHWPSGCFGYFPSYTLGAMMAAQLKYAMHKDIPNWREGLALGEMSQIFEWCKEKIHKWASYFPSKDALLIHSLGEELSPKYFLRHIKERYDI